MMDPVTGVAGRILAEPNHVIVALGSNLGDSTSILKQAIERLRLLSAGRMEVSSFWRSAPVDCPAGSGEFVNAVAVLEAQKDEQPRRLLRKLQELEKEFGREPKRVLNEARPLDLDLIAFGRMRMSTKSLIVPHPRAHLRRFVMAPLAEIAPGYVLPGQNRTAGEILDGLPAGGVAREAGRPMEKR